MSQVKIRFFSDDEIEAVDMEIETLLLAKQRQDAQATAPDTNEAAELSSMPKGASDAPISTQSVENRPADTVTPSSSVLPPKRMIRARPSPTTFRIIEEKQDVTWPKSEHRPPANNRSQVQRRRSMKYKWFIVLAVTISMWVAIISGFYALWHSNLLLATARFVMNMLDKMH